MADLFLALGVFLLFIGAVTALVTALAMRAVIRANRVAPGRRTAAPVSWLFSTRLSARLHRRLRRAVATSSFAVVAMTPSATPLREVAGELVDRAVAIDDWLVATNGLHPDIRRSRMSELAAEVDDIERSAARLHQICGDWRRCLDQASGATAVPAPNLHQRLDAVEAALRELPLLPPPSQAPASAVPAATPATPLAAHPLPR